MHPPTPILVATRLVAAVVRASISIGGVVGSYYLSSIGGKEGNDGGTGSKDNGGNGRLLILEAGNNFSGLKPIGEGGGLIGFFKLDVDIRNTRTRYYYYYYYY
ncbi:hypothetical protein IWZ03DRAFT_361211 [Phyllosticta citriasiana]|uniref:Uncharacterized protein n=1 Tax=Phyllosticta citriasiana TaxID=595635 RepID=A0ABR1KIP3_9PEZI